MKIDDMTKYQRYNKKHPVIAFRGDPEMIDTLDKLAEKESKSRQQLLYNIIQNYLRNNMNVKVRYVYEES